MSSNKSYRYGGNQNFNQKSFSGDVSSNEDEYFNDVIQPEPEVDDIMIQPEPPLDQVVNQDRSSKSKHIVSGCRRLNIRQQPSTSADIIGTFMNSEVVEVISVINEDWIEVKTRYGNGFIMSKFVAEVE